MPGRTVQACPSYKIFLSTLEDFLKDWFDSDDFVIQMRQDAYLITLPEGKEKIPEAEFRKLRYQDSGQDGEDGIAS